ncbi:hypothetical protein [Conexibacter arvalis]|uniref:Uncharacterized protein n=1 Tax=Conexibacter arvalis TaxID=912552 RepID=A0A840IJH5_9ACTN|nr:hypothetical protein [Conexibacter arvalis]MBB4665237.1 hypothetical protein [Conexibacter arvalis]
MKQLVLSAALAVVSLLAFTSVASAGITSPAPGGTAQVHGTLEYQGGILTATCSATFNGTVLSVTSVRFTSGSSGCTTGALSFNDFPWLKKVNLDGTWELGDSSGSQINMIYSIPVIGDCGYGGVIGGIWISDGSDTILIVSDELSGVFRVSGSFLCTDRPALGGTFVLRGVTTE